MTTDEMMEKSDKQFREAVRIANEFKEIGDKVITERDSFRKLAGELLERMKLINGDANGCQIYNCKNHDLIKKAEAILK